MAVTRFSDLVGRVLSGRYRLVAPIGSGASAQVLLADDTRLRRRVAVKLLHAALADDEGFIRRFRTEAQAAAALNHPHILAVYDWGEDDGTPYLVTEYLAGGSLRSMLDLGRRLTPSQTLLVGLEASRALEHAHRRGFVHRDIKPANLLFGEDGRLRIADFGLARALAEAAWTEPAGAVVGTARYASPEQVRGERVDGRADVYTLALSMIEAVTGRVPFAADTTIATLMARVDKHVDVPAELGPLRRVLARAGAPTPAERPDAGEFAVGLMAAAEELDRPAPLPLAGAIAQGSEPVDDRDPTLLPSTTTAIDPTTTVAIAPVGDEAPAGDYVEPGGQTKRRRRWPMILVGALIVGALAVAGLIAWNTVLVPEHEVPNFVGTTIAEAEELIDQNNWDLAEPREVRRDDTEPGQVLDQDPDPGASLREGDEVVLTISAGQELHAVPQEVIGILFADAQALLQQAGLAGVEAERRNDEAVARDSVIAFAEGTPEQAETGSEIGLVVSDGPAPRTIPETAGNTLEQACAAIGGVQLQCEQGQAFSDTVPQGTVIGTDPPAGQQVPRDSAVTVLVSQGPELRPIPDVSGRDVVTAAQMLEDAGFTVAGVQGNPFRTVRATNPPAGTRERPGTGVVLITG